MFYEKLFKKLQENQIRYLIVGGLAVNLHGVPRMTADVDMAVAFDQQNIKALLMTLAELDYAPKAPVDPGNLANEKIRLSWQKEKNMRAFSFSNKNNPLEEIDVLLETPFDFQDAYDRRQVITAGPLRLSLASLDDLIATKQGTDRAQDDSDIAALKLVKKLKAAETNEDEK